MSGVEPTPPRLKLRVPDKAWAQKETDEKGAGMADSIMFQLGGGNQTSTKAKFRPSSAPSGRGKYVRQDSEHSGDFRHLGSANFRNEATSKLSTAKADFEDALKRRTAALGNANRYSATRHNVLKGVSRTVKPESLRLRKIGVDGLGRFDLAPPMHPSVKPAPTNRDYYMGLLAARNPINPGTTKLPKERPVFTVHGLQNHSSVPLGDPRLQRGTSQYKETFNDPADRAPFAPRHDHLQEHERCDSDHNVGPHAATGMGGDPALEDELAEKRRAYYRMVTEATDVRDVEKTHQDLRDKIIQRAPTREESYRFRNVFQKFAVDGRGAITLENFIKVCHHYGVGSQRAPDGTIDTDALVCIFAKCDTRSRGFFDFNELVHNLMGSDFAEKEQSSMSEQLKTCVGSLRNVGDGALQSMVFEAQPEGELNLASMSDADFALRQRIRKAFRVFDRDNSNSIDRREFDLLLGLLGLKVSHREAKHLFRFIDDNNSGVINFEEFYTWYVSKPSREAHEMSRPPSRASSTAYATMRAEQEAKAAHRESRQPWYTQAPRPASAHAASGRRLNK